MSQAIERIDAFLKARETSGNLDPEIITGMNGKMLFVEDLRLVLELAWQYEELAK